MREGFSPLKDLVWDGNCGLHNHSITRYDLGSTSTDSRPSNDLALTRGRPSAAYESFNGLVGGARYSKFFGGLSLISAILSPSTRQTPRRVATYTRFLMSRLVNTCVSRGKSVTI